MAEHKIDGNDGAGNVQAPERIWASNRTNGNCVVSFTSRSEEYSIEYIRADVAASQLAAANTRADQARLAVRVRPLVWYNQPEGQDVRIGRCGQIAYAVGFKAGAWGYQRHGDSGHTISRPGGVSFKDEPDAIDGADEDHKRRILEALIDTETDPQPDLCSTSEQQTAQAVTVRGWQPIETLPIGECVILIYDDQFDPSVIVYHRFAGLDTEFGFYSNSYDPTHWMPLPCPPPKPLPAIEY